MRPFLWYDRAWLKGLVGEARSLASDVTVLKSLLPELIIVQVELAVGEVVEDGRVKVVRGALGEHAVGLAVWPLVHGRIQLRLQAATLSAHPSQRPAQPTISELRVGRKPK